MKVKTDNGWPLRETLLDIANGNRRALIILVNMLDCMVDPSQLGILQKLNIKDKQFLKLWKYCADKDPSKMRATLDILNRNGYSKSTIEANLEEKKPLPFVYETVEVEGYKYWDWQLPSILNKNPEASYGYCIEQELEYWRHYELREKVKQDKEIKKLTKRLSIKR